jgi:hypothetical protein
MVTDTTDPSGSSRQHGYRFPPENKANDPVRSTRLNISKKKNASEKNGE